MSIPTANPSVSRLWDKFSPGSFWAASLALVCTASLGLAQSTWDGEAGTGAWGTATNWSSDTIPSTSAVHFFDAANANSQFTIDLGGDRAVAGLQFANAAGTDVFTFNNNTLTIGANGISNLDGQTQVINSAIALSAGQTWDTSGGGALDFNSTLALTQDLSLTGTAIVTIATVNLTNDVTLDNENSGGLEIANLTASADLVTTGSGDTDITGTTVVTADQSVENNGSGTLTFDSIQLSDDATSNILTLGGTGNITVNGVVSNGGTATASGLTKTGTGNLTLAGANTYSGATNINSGTVRITNAAALGATSTGTTVASGATLELSGSGRTLFNYEPLTISGTGADGLGALVNIAGNNVYRGNVTLAGDTLIRSDDSFLEFWGSFSGSGQTITLDGAGTHTLWGFIGTGSGGIVKNGTGGLQLAGSVDNTFTGNTVVNAGYLELYGGYFDVMVSGDLIMNNSTDLYQYNNGQIIDTATLTLNGGDYFKYGYYQVLDTLELNNGRSHGDRTGDRVDVTNTINSTGTSEISELLGLGDSAVEINVDSGTLTISATISDDVNPNQGFNKTGSGTLILTEQTGSNLANYYQGNTTVSEGILRILDDDALGTYTGNSTTVASGAQLQVDNNITVAGEQLILNGTGISSSGALRNIGGTNAWNGNIQLNSNSEIQVDTGTTLNIGGAISSAGLALTVETVGTATSTISGSIGVNALHKNGTGTLTVTNTNNQVTTNVNGGAFELGASNILQDVMDVNIAAGATFDTKAFTDTIDDIFGAGTLEIASGGTITADQLGNSSNQFTGILDVDGTLTLSSAVIGTGAVGTASNGTIILAGTGTFEVTDDFNFAGTLELGDGTLQISSTNSVFDLGTLHITGNSIINFSGDSGTTLNLENLTIDVGATVTVNGWTRGSNFWSADNWTDTLVSNVLRDTQGNDPQTRVTFSGYGADQTLWYTNDYVADEISVPEPSTYGAIMIGLGIAGFGYRKWRSKKRSTSSKAAEV